MSEFPKLSEIRAGDRLVADGGFTCLEEGQVVEVEGYAGDGLFVRCEHGLHFLDGQKNDAGECVGFMRVPGVMRS